MAAKIIAGAIEGAGLLGIDLLNPDILHAHSTDWYVLDAASASIVIRPDTVQKFEYRNESRISDYPVEQGSFASYNKVATPYDIRMTMICGGLNLVKQGVQALGINDLVGTSRNQPMQRSAFLDRLQTMLDSLHLYDIVTPDKTYDNCNLVHYDYRRESRDGVKLVKADCWFREVRVTSSATYSSSSGGISVNSASPSAANAANAGNVNTYALGSNPASIGVFQ